MNERLFIYLCHAQGSTLDLQGVLAVVQTQWEVSGGRGVFQETSTLTWLNRQGEREDVNLYFSLSLPLSFSITAPLSLFVSLAFHFSLSVFLFS